MLSITSQIFMYAGKITTLYYLKFAYISSVKTRIVPP